MRRIRIQMSASFAYQTKKILYFIPVVINVFACHADKDLERKLIIKFVQFAGIQLRILLKFSIENISHSIRFIPIIDIKMIEIFIIIFI